MPEIFVTSDTHFSHANIIKYCNRPYTSILEMNEALINNWNSVVKPEDDVIHLGDLLFNNSAVNNEDLLSALNGHKTILLGNHDSHTKPSLLKRHFSVIKEGFRIFTFPGYSEDFCFSHYPEHGDANCINFCGHVHEKWQHAHIPFKSLNVGVDVHNFTPITLNYAYTLYKRIFNDSTNNGTS